MSNELIQSDYTNLMSTSTLSCSVADIELCRERSGGRQLYVVPTSLSASSNSATIVQSGSLDSFDTNPANSEEGKKVFGSSSNSKGSKKKRKSFASNDSGINNENNEPNSICFEETESETSSSKKLRFREAGALMQANMCLPPSSAPSTSLTPQNSLSSSTSGTAKVFTGRSGLPRFHHTRSSAVNNAAVINNIVNNSANIKPNQGALSNSRSSQTPQSDKKRIVKVTEQNTAERPLPGNSNSSSISAPWVPNCSSFPAANAPGTPLTPKRKAKFFFTNPQQQQLLFQKDKELKDMGSPHPSAQSSVNNAPNSSSKLSSVSNALIRRLRKNVVKTPSTEIVRGFFDTAFTVTEDKVNNILSNLKVKSKWDYKEKSKKQEVVIKELRESVATLLAEAKDLRENCLAHEGHVNLLLRDSLDEFQETSQTISSLRIAEDKLKKELARYKDELSFTTSSMMKIKTDHSPLKKKVRDFEEKINELRTELANEQALHLAVAAERANLEIEFEVYKNKTEENLKLQKEQSDQRLEQMVQGYRDEVASLRAELSKRQSDVDRVSFEKSDCDRQKSLLHAELMLTQAKVREAESATERADKDVLRMTDEISHLKDQLLQRDVDMRSTLNSLTEIQRQASEEKVSLKAELSTLHGRCQLLEEERLTITAQLAAKKEEVLSLGRDLIAQKDFVAILDAKLVQREIEATAFKESLMQLEVEKELRARCEIREEAERRERIAANAQLMAIQVDCNNRIREIESHRNEDLERLKEDLTATIKQRDESIIESRKQADIIMGLENEVKQMSHALENASANHEAVEKLGRVSGELEIVKRRLREVSEEQLAKGTLDAIRIQDYEEKIRQGELQRRKLHNLVQELRGNIRVFARVRPFLQSDLPGGDMTSATPESVITLRQDLNSLRICKSDEKSDEQCFTFDRVFGPSVSQETLFMEVSEFVQSALDGYNVCLFSYGQTGSGKTHTMQGSGTGPMRGIIPRAMQQVGLYKNELEAKGWEYQMEVSFIEIYNEDIRDLLRSGQHEAGKHEIKRDAQGRLFVSDATMVSVDPNDMNHIESIMELAARHRSVGQTNMNERSSRSHSVFALHLKAVHAGQGIVLNGTLSLVDLAGSERLDRSQVTGAQLKETVAINKSLSALADVFIAIANKQPHIPFRNSKLTYLLQPALSGDGKTLMLVNLSPTEESYYESLCSLRLAKQVNQCELGKPKKQLREVSSVLTASASPAQPPSTTPVKRSMPNPTNGPTGGGGANMVKRIPLRK